MSVRTCLRVFAAVLTATGLSACYEYVPMQTTSAPNPRVEVLVTDRGRVELQPQLGQGVLSFEGTLDGRQDSSYVVHVAEVTHTLALNLAALTFQIPYGIAQAATIRVGYHYGARDRAAAGRAGWAALVVSVLFMGAMALVMLLAPRFILALYVDPAASHNTALAALAVQYLMVAAAFQLFDGAQAVAAGALRGLQDTRWPLVIALFGYWAVGFVIAIWLGFYTPLEGIGVWIGLAIGLVVVAILLTWRWHRREALGLVPG